MLYRHRNGNESHIQKSQHRLTHVSSDNQIWRVTWANSSDLWQVTFLIDAVVHSLAFVSMDPWNTPSSAGLDIWRLMETWYVQRINLFIISILKSLVIPGIWLDLSSVFYSQFTLFSPLNHIFHKSRHSCSKSHHFCLQIAPFLLYIAPFLFLIQNEM